MNIKDLTNDLEKVSNIYADNFGINRTPEWLLLKLMEEVGELTQAYLKCNHQSKNHKKNKLELLDNLEEELADVLGMVLVISNKLDIDIENAVSKKWLKYLPINERTCI